MQQPRRQVLLLSLALAAVAAGVAAAVVAAFHGAGLLAGGLALLLALLGGVVGRRIGLSLLREVEARERRLKALLQNASDVVSILGADGTIRYESESARSVLGYAPEELVGRSALELVHPDDREEVGQALAEVVQTPGGTIRAKVRFLHSDGSWRVLEAMGTNQLDHPDIRGIVANSRDVTDQERLRRQLEQSERLLQAAGHIGRFGGWTLDVPSMQVTWSEEVYHIHELPLDYDPNVPEAIRFYAPEDVPVITEAVERAVEHAEPYDLTLRFITAKGNERWVRTVCEPVFEDGAVARLVGMFQDITEPKRTEEALRENRARFRNAFDHAAIGKAIVGTNGEWLEVNPALCEIVGYREEELLERTFQDITHPDDLDADLAYVEQMFRGEIESYQMEKRYLHKQGHVVWILLSGSMVHDEEGNVKYFIAEITDITDQKRAESRFRGIVEQSLVGFSILQDERFAYVSPHLADMLGYAPEALIGRPVYDFLHEDEHERIRENLGRRIDGEVLTERYNLRARRRDGTEVVLEVHGSLIEHEGRPAVLSSVLDVTERVGMEVRLQRTMDDLRRSNEELEQFAYVASHDLQEPLRMVASYTQLLARRYRGQLDETADEFIAYAVDGASRMQTLIQDLLAYSRVGTRGGPAEPVDSAKALATSLRNLRATVEETGAEVTHDALPEVLADEAQLVQLFQNLVGNALKYRSEAPPRVHVSVSRDGEAWHFTVRDNGIGIAPRFADRIFVIFQRLHGRDAYEGTGIGLAVCKKIVERHGGRIWVESEEGEGATFHFTLPARRRSDWPIGAAEKSYAS